MAGSRLTMGKRVGISESGVQFKWIDGSAEYFIPWKTPASVAGRGINQDPERAGGYSRMAIPHAVAGQPIDVRPLGAALRAARTVALFKSDDLEVMRIVLLAGKSVPPHAVPGEISLQCLEGRVALTSGAGAEAKTEVLSAGQLVYLAGGALHSLLGVEDASVLVTIVLHR